jgi:DNA polymerase-3 subunit gamma/tau
MLGTVDTDYAYRIVEALQTGDGAALLAECDAMTERSVAFAPALDELASLLHRIAVAQVVPAAATAFEDAARVTDLAARMAADEVQLAYQIVVQGRADLALAPDEAMGFSMTLLRLLAFRPDAGDESVPPREPTAAPKRPPRATAPAGTRGGSGPRRGGERRSAPDAGSGCTGGAAAGAPARGAGRGAATRVATLAAGKCRLAGLRRRPQAHRHRRAARRADRVQESRGQRADAGAAADAQTSRRPRLRRQAEAGTRGNDRAQALLAFEVGTAAEASLAARERREREEERPATRRRSAPSRSSATCSSASTPPFAPIRSNRFLTRGPRPRARPAATSGSPFR